MSLVPTRNNQNGNAGRNLFNMFYKFATNPVTQNLANKASNQMLKQMGERQPKGKKRAFRAKNATNVQHLSQRVVAPVAVNSVRRQGGPRMTNRRGGNSITVTHSERFDTVSESTIFSPKSFSLQPAIGTGAGHMFPWLAGIARQYETYRFNYVKIKYQPNVATQTPGHIVIAPDYDPLDPLPASGIEVESYKSAISGPIWQALECTLAPADLARRAPKFTRLAAAPLISDLKSYDTANIIVTTEGGLVNTLAGYLYVEYSVELFTPSKPSALEAAFQSQQFDLSNQFLLAQLSIPGTNNMSWTKINNVEGHLHCYQPGKFVLFMSHDQVPDPGILFNPVGLLLVDVATMHDTITGYIRWRVEINVLEVADKNNPPYIQITQANVGISGFTMHMSPAPR